MAAEICTVIQAPSVSPLPKARLRHLPLSTGF
jgi:hypothetical protein